MFVGQTSLEEHRGSASLQGTWWVGLSSSKMKLLSPLGVGRGWVQTADYKARMFPELRARQWRKSIAWQRPRGASANAKLVVATSYVFRILTFWCLGPC